MTSRETVVPRTHRSPPHRPWLLGERGGRRAREMAAPCCAVLLLAVHGRQEREGGDELPPHHHCCHHRHLARSACLASALPPDLRAQPPHCRQERKWGGHCRMRIRGDGKKGHREEMTCGPHMSVGPTIYFCV
ncbi:Os03g0229801 [Oryza sativa Japonica Group]|uniref:Os03g0229801 protein n=1 Tax=Oryza sativa subsp. japonica TaxID=39947 RepID=C7J0L0_ORYSJ|nr:Os03g0229801 [Oryza sativa Japonica Group]|eukprot:NP_001173330.1 Os03g0229801 [Oryza sativa Japonica Group]